MGGSGGNTTQEDTQSMLTALVNYGPSAIRAIADTAPYTAGVDLGIQEQIAPRQAALETDLYKQYGPEINRIGSEIDRQNQLAASQTELDIARGPGQDLVSEALALQQQADPEYYKTRSSIGDALSSWLGSMSPTGELSPTELEQINRGLSSRSGSVAPSAMETIKNAAAFGDARNKKWAQFGTALGQASAALPALQSGLPAFEIATRRKVGGNTGDQRLSQSYDTSTALDQTFGMANNILSEVGATQRTNLNKKKDTLDKIMGGASAFNSAASGVGSLF